MRRASRDDGSTRLDEILFRIEVVELLRMAKKNRTYNQLSQLTGLPATVLSRYVLGHVLPTLERAMELWKILTTRVVNIHDLVLERIEFDGNGFFDNTHIIFDPFTRKFITSWIYEKLMGTRVNKILTAAVDGVPLAVSLSDRLGVPVVVAKKEKEVGIRDFWTVDLVRDSGKTETLYVPKSWLRRKDWVVIIDDVIRTGETQRALIRLVEEVGAKLSGVFIIVSVGDWRDKISVPDGCRVEVLVTLNKLSNEG